MYEHLERASEIEAELEKLEMELRGIQGAKMKGMGGVAVDITPAWLRYKTDMIKLLNERKATLEAEFEAL